jgi:EpsI family protein
MIPKKPYCITLGMMLLTLIASIFISNRAVPVLVALNLDRLPAEINGLYGREDHFSKAIYDELNADQHIYRHYTSPNGEAVHLYIGYYGTAKGGRTGHNPRGCLPGQGWAIIQTEKIIVASEMARSVMDDAPKVNKIIAKHTRGFLIMYHWYQTRGRKVLDSGVQQNVERFIGKVFLNHNDGAFVQISVFADDESEVDKANGLAKSFAIKIIDLLPKYWPSEKNI